MRRRSVLCLPRCRRPRRRGAGLCSILAPANTPTVPIRTPGAGEDSRGEDVLRGRCSAVVRRLFFGEDENADRGLESMYRRRLFSFLPFVRWLPCGRNHGRFPNHGFPEQLRARLAAKIPAGSPGHWLMRLASSGWAVWLLLP
jgi:hypothetical protein